MDDHQFRELKGQSRLSLYHDDYDVVSSKHIGSEES